MTQYLNGHAAVKNAAISTENPLLYYHPDGGKAGRDPADISPEIFEECGHHPAPILAVIREKCIDCSGGSKAEVRYCTVTGCPLWPYRMGRSPFRHRSGRLTGAAAKNLPK